jgi:hypothetical protein
MVHTLLVEVTAPDQVLSDFIKILERTLLFRCCQNAANLQYTNIPPVYTPIPHTANNHLFEPPC